MSAIFGALPNGNNLLQGKGRCYFDRFTTAGVKTGKRFLGNVDEVSPSVSENLIKKFTSVDGSSSLLARVANQRESELTLKFNEITQKNSALALVGTEKTLAQTGATATDEIITPAGGTVQGNWYDLSKRAAASITTLKDDDVSVVAGTANANWYYDAATGMVYVTPGGSIVDGSVLKATYTYPTQSLNAVSGLDANIRGAFHFVGDPASGPIVELEIWNGVISADSALALISEDFAEYSIKIGVLYDATMAAAGYPYFRLIVR